MTTLARFNRLVAAAAWLRARAASCLLPSAHFRSPSIRRPAAAVIAALWIASAIPPIVAFADSFVRLDYNVGLTNHAENTVFLRLFSDRPLTTNNFLQYVNSGRYANTMMHGIVPDHLIQGGGYFPSFATTGLAPFNTSLDPAAIVDLDGNPATPNPTVANESGNSPIRSNLAGTIAMALSGTANSAQSQWLVNLADNSTMLDQLDGGFTVFGQVVGDGMTLFGLINSFNPNDPQRTVIYNLNADANHDGIANESGPFSNVPLIYPYISLGLPLIPTVNSATQIDYYGNGTTTNVPAGGLSIVTRDAFIDNGATFTGLGRLIVGSGRSLGVRDGISLSQGVLNIGTFAPGLQVGTVTLPSYQQTAEGTLAIQLRGTTINTQYDRLNVTGLAQMSGNIDVSLIGSFLPTPSNTFTILTANTINGTFAVNLPLITAGYVWKVSVTGTALTLTVVAADYNKDGVVNAADYTKWRDTLGAHVTPFSSADGDGSGIVDQADYLIWKNSFGETSGGSSGSGSSAPGSAGAVPEPASIVLFTIAAMALFSRKWRARRS